MSVKLENICYTYSKKTVMAKDAVCNVNLCINDGEFVALLGNSGCGKSTLLSLIASIEKPTFGSVSVDNGIGMMFQSPESQLFAQTVLEDVMYGPENIGLNEKDAKDSATDALKLVGMDESTWKLNPSKLSGGEKRKVALAGILAMNKPILLLDEPTSGLDNKSAWEVMNALESLNKQGKTIIMATHESAVAITYAKRIIVMEEGSIVFDGSPENISDEYEKLISYGIDISQISKIGNLLFKKGLIKEKNLSTAREIYEALNINKK